ncbi:MAG TPA: hypothetical protein VGK64_08465 [Bryobacteraceae bacterium]
MFGKKSYWSPWLLVALTWPACPASNVAIYDFANVGTGTLEPAQALAVEIFARAGIAIRLDTATSVDGKPLGSDFSASALDGCIQSPTPAVIRAQILPHAPPGFPARALAYSLPCAQRGTQITLYADRMEAVSRTANASFYRVLGYSLAHELGHVLRRSNEHDARGLMKDVWTRQDWRRAAVSIIFNSPRHPPNSNLSASLSQP